MRDITQLHPALQEKIKELQALCEKKGYKIGIAECLRTVEEQDALYAKGRTAPGSKVTNAKGNTYSSMHQWGIAFDFYRNDGKGAYDDSDGFFEKVGKLGESIGLEWGGSWKSIVDKPHLQLKDWGSTPSKLKALYGTPEKFFATWPKTVKVAELAPKAETKTTPKKIKMEVRYTVTAKSGLRIRKAPVNGAIIAAMPYKATFVSDGTVNGSWVKGTWNGITGWASGQYLKK